MTQVATVTINYNAGDLALQAVESILEADHGGIDVEVHLIDNASPNGDGDMLAAEIEKRGWSDKVVYHQETTNHGFGRGNNLVLNQVWDRENKPDYAFFLNPDAKLKTSTISELVSFLDANPKVAIAGAALDEPNEGGPAASAFRFPTIQSEFSHAMNFGPVARMMSQRSVAMPPDLPTQPVDWVSGSGFMARLDALAEVDFFDPAYFLYFEEMDMMWHVRKKGWEIWHVDEARIEHIAGVSTGMKDGKTASGVMPDYWWDSWSYYLRTNRGMNYARLCAFARFIGWCLRKTIALLPSREYRGPKQFLDGFWRRAVRPMFGLEAR